MKHTKTLFALLAVLTLTATVACQKEENEASTGNTDTVPTDTIPTPPEPETFSLTGTAWMMVQDEWWTSTMHVIDTSIWRFQTDSTGIFSEHFIYNDNDPYGVETYPMIYSFDASTLTGTLYGYEYPLEFTYHPEDTTLTYVARTSQTTYTYHFLQE